MLAIVTERITDNMYTPPTHTHTRAPNRDVGVLQQSMQLYIQDCAGMAQT